MEADAIDSVRAALLEALILSAPILGVGLIVGLIVSLFQAVTQIQEQTLTFVPKILAMLVVTIVLLSWILIRISEFAVMMFTGS